VCSLCASLGASRYWSDAAGHEAFRRNGGRFSLRLEREARVGLLNQLLSGSGVSVRDWGGSSYVVQNRQGRRQNAYTLSGVWAAADLLCGGECDPLDPRFLDSLNRTLKVSQ
jgi:hypothetical protein